MIAGVMGCLARECESWHDDVWLVDSTPVECGTSRETQKRSDLARPGKTLIADKGYRSQAFEADLNNAGITLLRPATKNEAPRPGAKFLRPLRQIIESINQTLKGPLTLERHKARTKAGVAARIGTRLLAVTAAFWHNETYRHTRPARSLTAYDH